jgi:ubiquinone/menaquinone biosynthesis C-methylase UbiE
MPNAQRYVPALGFKILTRLYDPIVALTTREYEVKHRLVEQATLRESHRVLDLACGTGTLAIMMKRHVRNASIEGVDGDADILQRARRKARSEGVEVALSVGLSTALPFESNAFDRVLSSLFFHHLTSADKARTVREVLRVLRPGGEFHVADWGQPSGRLQRAGFLIVRALDGFDRTRDNVEGRLPALFTREGFDDVQLRDEMSTMLGTMALISMRKAGT